MKLFSYGFQFSAVSFKCCRGISVYFISFVDSCCCCCWVFIFNVADIRSMSMRSRLVCFHITPASHAGKSEFVVVGIFVSFFLFFLLQWVLLLLAAAAVVRLVVVVVVVNLLLVAFILNIYLFCLSLLEPAAIQ